MYKIEEKLETCGIEWKNLEEESCPDSHWEKNVEVMLPMAKVQFVRKQFQTDEYLDKRRVRLEILDERRLLRFSMIEADSEHIETVRVR